MFKCFFWNREWALRAYGGAALPLICVAMQVGLSLLMNEWFKQVAELLNSRKVIEPMLGFQLRNLYAVEFLGILVCFAVSDKFGNWIARNFVYWWREPLTAFFLRKWEPVATDIKNPGQRIQDDILNLIKETVSISLTIFRSVLTLIAFIPILWNFSELIDINCWLTLGYSPWPEIETIDYIPGAIIWMALIISLIALPISKFLGRNLQKLEYKNRDMEANFREALVCWEKDKKAFSVMQLSEFLAGIRKNYNKYNSNLTRYEAWLHIFDQFMYIFPLWFFCGGVLVHTFEFQDLTQMIDAFGKLYNSGFGLLIINLPKIVQLRTAYQRLAEFNIDLNIQHLITAERCKKEDEVKEKNGEEEYIIRRKGVVVPFRRH